MASLAAHRGSAASLRTLSSSLSSLSVSSSSHSTAATATAAWTTTTQQHRSFTTTPRSMIKTINLQRIPNDPVPAYPYGPRLLYKQSNNGLYGESRVRTGHNISKDNKVKTNRQWRPNIHRKRLWSPSLGAWVQTRLSIRVLRTIRKEGGIDNYVLKSKTARIKELGPGGWKLRWLVMQTSKVRADFDAQRAKLGLPSSAELDEMREAEGFDTLHGGGTVAQAWVPGLEFSNEDIVHVMLDSATPGPLNARSRKILEDRAAQVAAMQAAQQMIREQGSFDPDFALGEEADVADDMLVDDLDGHLPGVDSIIDEQSMQRAMDEAAGEVGSARARNKSVNETEARASQPAPSGAASTPAASAAPEAKKTSILAESVAAAVKKAEQVKKKDPDDKQ